MLLTCGYAGYREYERYNIVATTPTVAVSPAPPTPIPVVPPKVEIPPLNPLPKSVLKEKDAYTSEILDTLKEAKMLVVEGTVYPLLTRLKNDGLLNYRWEESTSGPPRKYYGLTELGKTFLTELNSTWTELADAVNIITNKK